MALAESDLSPPHSQRADLLLAIDRGNTMEGSALAATVTAISGLLDRLDPDDRLGLILFNGKVILPAPLAPIRDGSWLRRVLGQFEPRGEADLSAAIERGFTECRRESCRNLVVVSAGRPTLGQCRPEKLELMARSGNAEGVRLSTVSFGDAAGRSLLARLASAGGGSAIAAEDADTAERALFRLAEESSRQQGPETGPDDHDPGGVDQ